MTRFRIGVLSVCALALVASAAFVATTKIWVSDSASDFSAE